MRARLFTAFALVAASVALAQQPAPAPKKAEPAKSAATKSKPKPKKTVEYADEIEVRLLRESYSAAAGLDSEARATFLIELCQASEALKTVGDVYCRELFQLAKDQLPAGDLRQHAQATATMSMSITDPDAGLAMLKDVDIANTTNDERASAARVVFQSVLRKHGNKAFPDLLATASSLGDSGAYPYFATTLMLYGGNSPGDYSSERSRNFTDEQVDRCSQVLQQALTFFKKQSLNVSLDFQFMTLLRAAAVSRCPSDALLHQAATDFADELVRTGNAALQGDEHVRPQGVKNLYDSGARTLQQIDPALSNMVEKKVGAVRDLKTESAPPLPGKTAPDWHNDPDVQALVKKIDSAGDVLNNAPDGTTPHTPPMADAIREGIWAAQKLADKVQEIDPEAAAVVRRGAGSPLPTMMDAAMRIWPEAAVEQIESLPDGELKAHLLVLAARRRAANIEHNKMEEAVRQ